MRGLLLFAAVGSLVAGCSSASNGNGNHTPAVSHAGSDAGTSGVSIRLGDGVGLTFSPGTPRTIPVQVAPPGVYPVRFSLIGEAGDAYLDKSEADTDANGQTSVVLTPPSTALSFKLRASVTGAWAELPISAPSTTSTVTIQVAPAYAGKRKIETWTASVKTGTGCDPSTPVPLADGLLLGVAAAGQVVLVPNVPVGVPLRVTVRAGNFAGGCTEVPAFKSGEIRTVSVTVADRPLQMNGVSMPVVLGIGDGDAFVNAWTKLTTTMATAVVPSGSSDASALLDAMRVETPYLSQDSFSVARTTHGWDARVSAAFASGPGPTAIRDAVTRWITAGRSTLSKEFLRGTLTSPDTGMGTATLSVSSIGGEALADAGFPSTVSTTWSSAPSDQVLFGGSGSWIPSHLAAALAASAAHADVASAASVPDALAALLSCDDVASAIGSNASDLTLLSCNTDCLASRCKTALEAMWAKAVDAVATRGAVHFAASGGAAINDVAEPVGLTGSWVGDASFGSGATTLSGPAGSATTSPIAR